MRTAILLTLLLTMSATPSVGDGQSDGQKGRPRVVKFAGGETTVESNGDTDHVVVKDGHGKLMSESWCDSGTFDEYLGLFTKIKDALGRQDRGSIGKLVSYPFRVNGKKPLTFRNAASLLKVYDKVFTPAVLEKVRAAEPAAVFCRDGQGMLGDGVIWATASAGAGGATVLNP